MKTGKTLVELAQEIERQANTKKDFVAPASALTMQVAGNGTPLLEVGALALTEINELAHDQIGQHVGIPATYYDRMRAEDPNLLALNVNRWFKDEKLGKTKRMVRTLDGRARAYLSDAYRPLENFDLAEAVLPVLMDLKLMIISCEITERRLYIKAVDQRIKQDIPSGRWMGDGSHTFFHTCSPALIVSNSEVGQGPLAVDSGVWTDVCTNLAAIANAGMKRRHVGTRHDMGGEEIRALLSDDTKKATDKAVFMQVRDVVKAAFDEARFKAHCDKLKGMQADKIEGDPVKAVEVVTKKLGITETERPGILRHLIEGGDLSRYGVFNAITRASADIESYDRATAMEFMGGQVIELPKHDWQEIAKAA